MHAVYPVTEKEKKTIRTKMYDCELLSFFNLHAEFPVSSATGMDAGRMGRGSGGEANTWSFARLIELESSRANEWTVPVRKREFPRRGEQPRVCLRGVENREVLKIK